MLRDTSWQNNPELLRERAFHIEYARSVGMQTPSSETGLHAKMHERIERQFMAEVRRGRGLLQGRHCEKMRADYGEQNVIGPYEIAWAIGYKWNEAELSRLSGTKPSSAGLAIAGPALSAAQIREMWPHCGSGGFHGLIEPVPKGTPELQWFTFRPNAPEQDLTWAQALLADLLSYILYGKHVIHQEKGATCKDGSIFTWGGSHDGYTWHRPSL